MSDQDPSNHTVNSLAVYQPRELAFLGMPTDLVERAVATALPAIQRTELPTLFSQSDARGGTALLISEPPYDTVQTGQLRSIEEKGVVTVNFDSTSPHTSIGVAGPLGRFDLVARASEPEVLEEQIRKQHELKQEKQRFVDENPLGEAGLLLNNRFGGVDVEDPELTARHLIMRLAIARRAKMGSVGSMIKLGLIDPTLGHALSDELAGYFDSVGKIVDVVGHLPEATAAATASVMLEGAIELGRHFIAANGKRINLASRIVQDPAFAKTVLRIATSERAK